MQQTVNQIASVYQTDPRDVLLLSEDLRRQANKSDGSDIQHIQDPLKVQVVANLYRDLVTIDEAIFQSKMATGDKAGAHAVRNDPSNDGLLHSLARASVLAPHNLDLEDLQKIEKSQEARS